MHIDTPVSLTLQYICAGYICIVTRSVRLSKWRQRNLAFPKTLMHLSKSLKRQPLKALGLSLFVLPIHTEPSWCSMGDVLNVVGGGNGGAVM